MAEMTANTETVSTDLSVEEAKKQAFIDRMAKARLARREKHLEKKDAAAPVKKAQPVIEAKDTEIKWFSEVDYNQYGNVASDYPLGYFDTKELKEDIRVLAEQVEDNIFQGKRKREATDRLFKMRDRLDKIESAWPKLQGKQKDKVANSMRDLGERIKESMFSYDSHWKQTADPHVVAERMVTPCIEVKDEYVASYAKQRGFRIIDGKISQNDASVIFKVFAKNVGEPSDTNRLRPLRAHGITI